MDCPNVALNLTLAIDLRCDLTEPIPTLAEAEELVESFVCNFTFYMLQLLQPPTEKAAKVTPSLVAVDCNPELRIFLRHPNAKAQSIKIVPATHGAAVEAYYEGIADENGRVGCYGKYEMTWEDEKEGTVSCRKIA